MDSQGLRGSNNPKAMLSSLLNKREKLQNELRSVEKQVYELETSYLQETNTFGNAFKGFDGFLSSSKNTANIKRSRKFQLEDRVFSLSSVTSPAAEELRVGKEDGKSDMVQVRPKGGGSAAAAPGKPKKGRTGQRDVKRIRISSDLDPEDKDDLDLR
ncbi:chromatin modification-related protein meaf6 [Phtheirospermum japonicum]|uniref:Chromatin modification-related protein meaf6 n=1 Tax=Phtheirospermum japonicum TaxID=374723 RepID=A0A830BBD4_9LAMI|nr:chromatin modification-related protein meaf6 [Phtheirospermum japonicum]